MWLKPPIRVSKKLDVCRDLMYGFNYGAFFGKSDLERAKAISGGVDFMQSLSGWKRKTLYQRGAAAAAGIVALSEFAELRAAYRSCLF